MTEVTLLIRNNNKIMLKERNNEQKTGINKDDTDTEKCVKSDTDSYASAEH